MRGIDKTALDELLTSQEHRGSAAFRTYNSYVYPKSAAALANAEKPGRLATVAQSVCFLHRERKAQRADWLRNHDRTLAEVDAIGVARFPLHIVLDNVRSAHNTGNLIRAAEAARVQRVHFCGITPTPPHQSVLKTAMGAAETVPHAQAQSTLAVVCALQAEGVSVWACETCPGECRQEDSEDWARIVRRWGQRDKGPTRPCSETSPPPAPLTSRTPPQVGPST